MWEHIIIDDPWPETTQEERERALEQWRHALLSRGSVAPADRGPGAPAADARAGAVAEAGSGRHLNVRRPSP